MSVNVDRLQKIRLFAFNRCVLHRGVNMSESWFVLRSKPRKEAFLAQQLRMHGFGIFNPHIRVRTVNPRARKLRPYFPGYVFVRVDPDQLSRSTLQWMPGAAGLVSFGGEPARVPDDRERRISC